MEIHKEFEGLKDNEKQHFCAFEFELELEVAGVDAIWCFGVPLAPSVERADDDSCGATALDASDNSDGAPGSPGTPLGEPGLLDLWQMDDVELTEYCAKCADRQLTDAEEADHGEQCAVTHDDDGANTLAKLGMASAIDSGPFSAPPICGGRDAYGNGLAVVDSGGNLPAPAETSQWEQPEARRLSADARRPEDILRPEHRRRTLQDDYDEEATFRDGAPLRDREHRRRRQPDVDTLDSVPLARLTSNSGDSSSAAASLTLTPYEFARRTRRCRIDFINWMERAREGDSS